MEDPRRLATLLCEQIIESWVHDTILEFLSEALDGEHPSRELVDKVYKLAMSADVNIPEEEK